MAKTFISLWSVLSGVGKPRGGSAFGERILYKFGTLSVSVGKWNTVAISSDVKRYESQLEWADEVIYVDEIEGYECKNTYVGDYHPAKMDLRNRYMVDNSDLVIAVWNGTKGGTCNCVKYAKKKDKSIIFINPDEI